MSKESRLPKSRNFNSIVAKDLVISLSKPDFEWPMELKYAEKVEFLSGILEYLEDIEEYEFCKQLRRIMDNVE